jgi:hypothetical protein
VPRVHPGRVGEPVEALLDHAVVKRVEPRGVLLGVADAAREQPLPVRLLVVDGVLSRCWHLWCPR